MLNTETAKYSLKISVPVGVNRNTAQLFLIYEGGYGKGPCNMDWSFEPENVSKRTDKGIPRYIDNVNKMTIMTEKLMSSMNWT